MSLTIRLAVRDDAALLPDIERSAGTLFRTLPDLAWIADDGVMSVDTHEQFIRAGTCWVADDGRLIGFISTEIFDTELHIWEISVSADHHRRGIGQRLIVAAISHARYTDCVAVTLTTFRNVGWNEPYYARLGFETLRTETLCPRLHAVLESETEQGLPIAQRCAMRLGVN